MTVEERNRTTISEVFCVLGLETDEERRRYRLLGELGRTGPKPEQQFREPVQTRNNTSRDEDYAELE